MFYIHLPDSLTVFQPRRVIGTRVWLLSLELQELHREAPKDEQGTVSVSWESPSQALEHSETNEGDLDPQKLNKIGDL